MKKYLIVLIAIGTLTFGGLAFTQKTNNGGSYCLVMENGVNNNIKVRYAGDNRKGSNLETDTGENIKDLPHALQVMESRGWEVVDSYAIGTTSFADATVILRREN